MNNFYQIKKHCIFLSVSLVWLGMTANKASAALAPPAITVQPVSAVVTTGSVAGLSVSNSGTGPFGYQWMKDGVILAGQTNSTLSFSSFKFTDSGSYSVVITNAQGMTISFPANLSVLDAPLRIWGANNYGKLGNGTTASTNRPIQVASNVVAAAGGNHHSLFVKADGTLWAMGYNGFGQLGNGTLSDTSLPVQVASNVVSVAGGLDHSLFVKADGTLWGMGLNSPGQLGNGTTAEANMPVQVASNVVSAACGQNHSLFVKADGTLWAMGYNMFGQLGNGTTADTNMPVQVASNVVAAAGGPRHSLFVKSDGTLWAMGANTSGQLGNGTTASTNRPIQVASNVVSAAGGGTHSLFVKADGTLWGMGGNGEGELGNGTTTSTNRPIQVASNVVAAAGGYAHSLFVKADGTLWAMGYNFNGQLGNGTTTDSLTPIQVTGLMAAGLAKEPTANHTLAIAVSVMTDQTISFPAISDKLTTDTVGLSATASSGLPVSFSVLSGSASISGGTNLTFSGAGSVSIVASQAGDSSYNAAPNVTNTFTVSLVPGLTTYADSNSGNDANSGLSWATAKKTIQAAINLVGDGGTVWVTNGTYSVGSTVTPGYSSVNRVCIINNITVQSVNGPAVTIIDGGGSVRCVYMRAGTLSGLTLTKGSITGFGDWPKTSGGGAYLAGGTLNNCTLSGNSAGFGGGAYLITGGTLNNCTLNGNSATHYGGGAYLNSGGTLINCALSGNSAIEHGGGVYLLAGGTLNNCTLSGNTGNFGGGAYLTFAGGTLNNCTLSGNTGNSGGGAYLIDGGTLNNCIVWGNSPFGLPNIYNNDGVVRYTCAPNGVTHNSNGCITNNPLFVSNNDFRLQPGSPCINAGNNAYVTTTNDLAGNPRIAFGTVDMGAYESQILPVTVPVALSAIDITSSQFTARWTVSEGATNYLLDVSQSIAFTSYTGGYNNRNVGNVTACMVTGLTDGVTYYYRVRAANQYGAGTNSNVITVPVSTNTPYIQYELTNGVASAGSSDVVDMTKLFHGTGLSYSVVSNSNPGLVAASFSGSDLILDYTPGVSGNAQITIRATDNSTGFWVENTITVSVAPAPGLTLGSIALNRQNGLYEQIATVSNTSPTLAAKAVTLTVTNLTSGASLYNATDTDEHGNPEIQWIGTLAPGGSMSFTLQYYTARRGTVPSATVLASLSLEDPQTAVSGSSFDLSVTYKNIGGTQSFLIEFSAVPGRTYYIQYTDALSNPWKTVQPKIVAPVNRIQWIDSGPPGTESAPGSVPVRFYRVIEAAE